MPTIIYILCSLTSLLCAWLLLRAYWKRNITLLFWCGVFFVIQACAEFFLVVDKLDVHESDLSVLRYGIALVAVGALLYGLIMQAEVD